MDFLLITHSLDESFSRDTLFKTIVNTPFDDRLQATELGLGIVVLLLVNSKDHTLDRVALSDTERAQEAQKISAKPFHEIRIPLDYKENLLIDVVDELKPQFTDDWAGMFVPELSPEEARFNQAGASIACSAIYPLIPFGTEDAIGAMIFSYFEPLEKLGEKHRAFMRAYADTVSSKLVQNKVIVL